MSSRKNRSVYPIRSYLTLRAWSKVRVLKLGLGLGLLGVISPSTSPVTPQGMAAPLPNDPVVDEVGILKSEDVKPLTDLLSEHQRLTDQKIVFAILKDSGEENEEKATQRIFHKWGLDQPLKGDSLLVALFWKTQTSKTEFGFGLESNLNVDEANTAIRNCLKKENLKTNLKKSFFCAGYRILDLLGSPLIESGKAAEIAEDSAITEPTNPSGEAEIPWGVIASITTGLTILGLAIFKILLRGKTLAETQFAFLLFWKKPTSSEFISTLTDDDSEAFEDSKNT